jgi:excinuclease UvrABC helicase subunit UvrB
MNGKDFHKRFEEFFNQFFNQDNQKFNTSMDGFLKALNPDDISNEMKKYRKSIKESNDGLFTTISFIFTNPPFSDKSEVNELKSKLDECVSNQDFEEAARLRDKIKEMENNSSKVKDLKKELDIAIKEQNFERAIKIRDELKKIN